MNQKTKVNTSPENEQVNVVNTTLHLSQIKHHLGDIESQALAAQTLGEICFEQLDSVESNDLKVAHVILRLDALVKAAYRNAVLVQESVTDARLLLANMEGGAQ
ncbi:hypothetical protein [Duganella sp. Leaf126]|uniref:hypothetical protein n=1 Tax=Duganella sp. Leaf126 TaxID=1736266 RepID=UPI0012E20BB4|nr:hypothetical protein [Duganella sp. Leaf126]